MVLCAGGMRGTLLLLQDLQKWQLGFFGLFESFVQNLPQLRFMQLFLVPYSFFELCCLKRGVSRCKPCSTAAEGPRSQPVSPPQEPATTRSVPRMATDLSYPIAGLRPMSVLIGQCPAILFVNCFYIIPGTY